MFGPFDTIQSSRASYLKRLDAQKCRRRQAETLLHAGTAFIILGVATAALFAVDPSRLAQAAEPQATLPQTCRETVADVLAYLDRTHETYVLLDPQSLVGAIGKDVKSIVVATLNGKLSVGVAYRDGCMSSPMLVDTIVPQA